MPRPPAADPVDSLARAGFGRGAAAYERGRPGYPVEAVAWLAERLRIGPGSTALDLGAGTGKLARMVQATGAAVVAVEPVAGMRAQLQAAVPGVRALEGRAEALPLDDESVDAVLCGEAFHWFDGPAALAQIARVLRPGGGLGLLWNVHAWDRTAAWVQALERVIAPHSDGRPETRYLSGHWRHAFVATSLFGPLEQRRFVHEQRLDRDGFVAHIASVSFIAALPDRARDRVLAEVERLWRTDAALARAATIALPYRTDAYWTATRAAFGAAGRRSGR